MLDGRDWMAGVGVDATGAVERASSLTREEFVR